MNPRIRRKLPAADKDPDRLRDLPQSISVVTSELMKDQMMMSIGDVTRYVPGVTAIQGENNRDQVVIRGNSSSADFYLNGVRDDVQYYRDLYNLEDVEALKGPNAMVFGRGGGGGVINRVTKEAGFTPLREISLLGGSYGDKRVTADLNQPLGARAACRFNGMFEDSDSFRQYVGSASHGIEPDRHVDAGQSDEDRAVLRTPPGRPHCGSRNSILSGQAAGRRSVDVLRQSAREPCRRAGQYRLGGGRAAIRRPEPPQPDAGRRLRSRVSELRARRGHGRRLQVALSGYNNATRRRNLFNQTDLTYSLSTGRVRHTLYGRGRNRPPADRQFPQYGLFQQHRDIDPCAACRPRSIATPVTWRQNATDADNRVRTPCRCNVLARPDRADLAVQVIAGARFDHFDLRFHNNRTGEDLRRIDNMISPRAGVVVKPWRRSRSTPTTVCPSCRAPGDQFSSLTSSRNR